MSNGDCAIAVSAVSAAESKELIAGFWFWQVKSIEEAIEWVKRCPVFYEGEAKIS